MGQKSMMNEDDLELEMMYINGSTARKQAASRASIRPAERPATRNPYLVDYSGNHRKQSRVQNHDLKREMDEIDLIYGRNVQAAPPNRVERSNTSRSVPRQEARGSEHGLNRNANTERSHKQNVNVMTTAPRTAAPRTASPRKQMPDTRSSRMSQRKRKKEVLRNRIILGVLEGIIIICLLIWVFKGMDKAETQVAVPDIAAGQQAEPGIGAVSNEKVQGIEADVFARHPEWEENFLTVSEYSRPGDPIGEVKNIFVHYTANPKTSAAQNRSYFEQLKDTKERGASAHFIIGYEGEIIQCVPMDEIAYAVMGRNEDSLSIECCFVAADGSFTQETYDSLIKLLKWLTDTYGLQTEDILRHYDCGGKKCPIYYTENEDAWEKLKQDVADYQL